jgi:hypothetical protein
MATGLAAAMTGVAHALSGHPSIALPIGVSFEAAGRSAYVWRGLEVQPSYVVQYDFNVSRGPFSVSAWANAPSRTFQNSETVDEVDLAVAYATTMFGFETTSSLITYVYPRWTENFNTAELCFEIAKTSGGFSLYLTNAFDVWRYKGAHYAEAGFSYQADISDEVAIEAKAGLAWGSRTFTAAYFGVPTAGQYGCLAEVDLTISRPDGSYFGPSCSIWYITSSNLRSAGTRSLIVTLGVCAGIAF